MGWIDGRDVRVGESTAISSYAPATGDLLGEVPTLDSAAVRASVERARRAQRAWAARSVDDRCEALRRYRDAVIEQKDELVLLLSRETGKPLQEALLHEVAVVSSLIGYFTERADDLLAPREIPLTLFKHRRSFVHYVPRGVVGVISPWNFPFLLPMRDVLLALLAGNAVVLKPSEVTPLIALAAKRLWDEAGLDPDLFQIVTGDGTTGAALIDAGIQFCVFTGAVSTGRRVAAACGERLIPCVMELGGKAPLIVTADVDVERAARGAVFGAFSNAGQICISVERVFVHERVADAFCGRVVELTNELRVGDPASGEVDVGAIIFPKQLSIVEAHISDALEKGATLLTGGRRLDGPGQFFAPTVLGKCDPSMSVMTKEIFGPILPIMRVRSDDEAVSLANDSDLGLNAYVFARDTRYGHELAERIEAGNVVVNDVLSNAGCPEAPFGGIKQSGFGRMMGDESLREMCDVKHISVDRIAPSNDPLWFPYSKTGLAIAKAATDLVLGASPMRRWSRGLLGKSRR